MARLPIVLYPNKVLATRAEEVTSFDEQLHTFLDDMVETMYAAEGVGLAANQVGVLQRVTVMDCRREGEETSVLRELINPEIIAREGTVTWEEGCLSFPGLYQKVRRSKWVKVRYQDRHGAHREVEGDGLLGVCLQHEIDHLDGVLFLDRVGALSRSLALRRYDKLRKAASREAKATP